MLYPTELPDPIWAANIRQLRFFLQIKTQILVLQYST
jgi:hypothetical protein